MNFELDGGTISAGAYSYHAMVTTREASPEVREQDAMRLYEVSFTTKRKRLIGFGETTNTEIGPLTVSAIHLKHASRLLVQYCYTHSDVRQDRYRVLEDGDAAGLEPFLGSMARTALINAGIDLGEACVEQQRVDVLY